MVEEKLISLWCTDQINNGHNNFVNNLMDIEFASNTAQIYTEYEMHAHQNDKCKLVLYKILNATKASI